MPSLSMLEEPLNDTQKRHDALNSLIAGMVALHDSQLTIPEVWDTPKVGHIRDLRETLLVIVDEDPLS